MEFRKMVTITLCTRQQKRHWCIEQSYGLCGRGRGWDDLGEWHWNLYTIMYETSRQSRFDAQYWMLGAGALGRPKGMVWRGRREEGSGWGTHVYLWRIHFDIWQNQYNIVKFKNKIKLKKKNLCFFVVQSLSHVWLFGTPHTIVCQAPLSFTVSRSLLQFLSTELVMVAISSSAGPFSFYYCYYLALIGNYMSKNEKNIFF